MFTNQTKIKIKSKICDDSSVLGATMRNLLRDRRLLFSGHMGESKVLLFEELKGDSLWYYFDFDEVIFSTENCLKLFLV